MDLMDLQGEPIVRVVLPGLLHIGSSVSSVTSRAPRHRQTHMFCRVDDVDHAGSSRANGRAKQRVIGFSRGPLYGVFMTAGGGVCLSLRMRQGGH